MCTCHAVRTVLVYAFPGRLFSAVTNSDIVWTASVETHVHAHTVSLHHLCLYSLVVGHRNKWESFEVACSHTGFGAGGGGTNMQYILPDDKTD
jgi:hypothetical protein